MGIFDAIKNQASGHVTNQLIGKAMSSLGMGNSPLLAAATQLLLSSGGFSGLAQRFQQNGMADIFNSWISPGQNQPINSTQVQNLFGQSEIASAAQDNQIPPEQLTNELPSLLPSLIDKLTPDGAMPAQDPSPTSILSTGFDILRRSIH